MLSGKNLPFLKDDGCNFTNYFYNLDDKNDNRNIILNNNLSNSHNFVIKSDKNFSKNENNYFDIREGKEVILHNKNNNP